MGEEEVKHTHTHTHTLVGQENGSKCYLRASGIVKFTSFLLSPGLLSPKLPMLDLLVVSFMLPTHSPRLVKTTRQLDSPLLVYEGLGDLTS